MKIQNIIVVAVAVTAFGCAKVWYKDGGTNDEFNKDRYECMQQAQQQVSTIAVGKYSGFGQSGQETNMALFNGCMNARGWTLNDKQFQDSANAEKKDSMEQNKARIKAMGEAVCSDPQFAQFFAKSSCLNADITLDQLADRSKPTAAQKAVMSPLLKALKSIYAENNAALRRYDGKKGEKLARYDEVVYMPKLEKLYLDLYNGKLTWGDFNRQRKENAEDYKKFKADLYGGK